MLYYIIQIYGFIWMVIMWVPFIMTSTTIYNFKQLTWWSWLIQTLFYTNMYVKTAKLFSPCRSIFKECLHQRTARRIQPTDFEQSPSGCSQFDYLFLGVTAGVAWFVFFMFAFILYDNPDFVYKLAQNSTDSALIQVGNVVVHYYTVTMLFVWTVFNSRYIKRTIQSTKRYPTRFSFAFSVIWLLVIFLYLMSWKFDIESLAKSYSVDDVPVETTIIYTLVSVGAVSLLNWTYISSLHLLE